jgi:CRISPR-associated protein Cas5h
MEVVVVFELRGDLAHYRRPDTFATQASYPIMPRTTLRGLIGAILGEVYRVEGDVLDPGDRTGLRLLSPIRTVAQELSLHGKKWTGAGTDDSFHRPTSIELVVRPHYRVFYSGSRLEELADRLREGQSVFHTYLGSAFCLTRPEWVGVRPAEPIPADCGSIRCATVVPSPAVAVLQPDDQSQYGRVAGVPREHLGNRRFRGTLSVIYERAGLPVVLTPAALETPEWRFRQVAGEGTVCLW